MEKVLLVNKKRTLWVIAFCCLAWLILLLLALNRHAEMRSIIWGMLCGAVAIVIYAMRLNPRVVYLKLTNKGFEYKYYLPVRYIEWKDTQRFTTYLYKFRRYVGWTYASHYAGPKIPFAKMVGVEGRFFENFGHSPRDLARLLEEWRVHNSNVF